MNKESGSVGKQLWRGCCRGVSGIMQSICFIPSSLLAACDVQKGCSEESLPAPSSGTRLGGCTQTWRAKVSASLASCACSLKAGTETCQGEHSACVLCGVAVVKINQERLGALIMKAYQLAWEASGVTSARAAALAVQMQQQCRKALKFSHKVQCKAPSCRCRLPFFPTVLPNPRMEIVVMPRWIHGAVPPFLLCPGPCPQECPGGDQAGTQCSREGVLCCAVSWQTTPTHRGCALRPVAGSEAVH